MDIHPTYVATEAEVTTRIDELAREIIARYSGQNPLFVCMLRGGAPFATRLMFAIERADPNFCPEMDYITTKTYGNARVDKQPELLTDVQPGTTVTGRTVILLDDVLDKGVTAEFASQVMHSKGAAQVDLIVLAQKNRERTAFKEATLYGFEAPEDWLTGMGMDNASEAKESHRWGGYIVISK